MFKEGRPRKVFVSAARKGVNLFLQARLISTSTKSVTYMPGTFCYRHASSHLAGYNFCLEIESF